jgi:hypothetical protein
MATMTPSRLNRVSSAISLLGALILAFVFNRPDYGFVWLSASIVWFVMSLRKKRDSPAEPAPVRRIARRLSRLILWG